VPGLGLAAGVVGPLSKYSHAGKAAAIATAAMKAVSLFISRW